MQQSANHCWHLVHIRVQRQDLSDCLIFSIQQVKFSYTTYRRLLELDSRDNPAHAIAVNKIVFRRKLSERNVREG